MDQWTLWFALLLPLSLGFDTEEMIVKTTGGEKDVTSLCSTAILDDITLIVCKIKTKGSGGEGCRLLYQHGQDFEHGCDSRFTLIKENQTVILQLINLTPEDSGKYTCECSHGDQKDILHLVIPEEEGHASPMRMLMSTTVIGTGTGFIIVAGVVIGLILRKSLYRYHKRPGPTGSVRELDKVSQEDTYTSLYQPPDDFYQTMPSMQCEHDADNNGVMANAALVTAQLKQEMDRRMRDQNFDIYENF